VARYETCCHQLGQCWLGHTTMQVLCPFANHILQSLQVLVLHNKLFHPFAPDWGQYGSHFACHW
jgi:hypothetical protein